MVSASIHHNPPHPCSETALLKADTIPHIEEKAIAVNLRPTPEDLTTIGHAWPPFGGPRLVML